MTVPRRLSIVTLGVSDVARSTAFYRALGWTPAPESQQEITFLRMDRGSLLALFRADDLAADACLPAPGPLGFRGVTTAINVDSDDEVRQVLATARAAGATVTRPAGPSPNFDGLDGYFTDPDGHAWEVAHNPGLPV